MHEQYIQLSKFPHIQIGFQVVSSGSVLHFSTKRSRSGER